jgi:hypothetical protein
MKGFDGESLGDIEQHGRMVRGIKKLDVWMEILLSHSI